MLILELTVIAAQTHIKAAKRIRPLLNMGYKRHSRTHRMLLHVYTL